MDDCLKSVVWPRGRRHLDHIWTKGWSWGCCSISCFIVSFTIHGTIVYRMNIMLCWRRFKTRDWDHKLIRETRGKEGHFLISLLTSGLFLKPVESPPAGRRPKGHFEVSGFLLCKFSHDRQCLRIKRLHGCFNNAHLDLLVIKSCIYLMSSLVSQSPHLYFSVRLTSSGAFSHILWPSSAKIQYCALYV